MTGWKYFDSAIVGHWYRTNPKMYRLYVISKRADLRASTLDGYRDNLKMIEFFEKHKIEWNDIYSDRQIWTTVHWW